MKRLQNDKPPPRSQDVPAQKEFKAPRSSGDSQGLFKNRTTQPNAELPESTAAPSKIAIARGKVSASKNRNASPPAWRKEATKTKYATKEPRGVSPLTLTLPRRPAQQEVNVGLTSIKQQNKYKTKSQFSEGNSGEDSETDSYIRSRDKAPQYNTSKHSLFTASSKNPLSQKPTSSPAQNMNSRRAPSPATRASKSTQNPAYIQNNGSIRDPDTMNAASQLPIAAQGLSIPSNAMRVNATRGQAPIRTSQLAQTPTRDPREIMSLGAITNEASAQPPSSTRTTTTRHGSAVPSLDPWAEHDVWRNA